jgi:hypothetical protein
MSGMLVGIILLAACPGAAQKLRPPYPPSPAIARIEWAPASEIIRLAPGSDNWPLAWADDGALYTAYGDGFGFEPLLREKLSLGFARVEGNPPAIRGVNIRSPSGEQTGDGKAGRKASGMLMVGGILYLWARNAGNAQLAWSENRGADWRWCGWKLDTSFGCPTFLSFGSDYQSARDEYVYIYSQDSDNAYDPANRMCSPACIETASSNAKAASFTAASPPAASRSGPKMSGSVAPCSLSRKTATAPGSATIPD